MNSSLRISGIALLVALLFGISNSIQADLVGFWNFDGNVQDQSSNSNDGVLEGGPTFDGDVPPEIADGQSMLFDGIDDYVDLGPAPELDFGTTDWTVAGWLKTSRTSPTATVFSNGGDWGGGIRYVLSGGESGDSVTLTTDDNSSKVQTNGTTPLADGEWHHIAAQRSGAEFHAYVDGVLEGSNTVPAGYDLSGTSQGPSLIGVGWRFDTMDVEEKFVEGWIDEVAVWDEALSADFIAGLADGSERPVAVPPLSINGGGESYVQNFDEMGTANAAPRGWSGEDKDGVGRRIDSLGLVDGPLAGAVDSAVGIVNVGGNPERFSASEAGRVATWKDDLDGSGLMDEGDVIADAATDRALGNARENNDEPGKLNFEILIADKPLRAFVAEWDLEIWGGDPEAAFRGEDGPGYSANLSVGGTSYYSDLVTLKPEGLFDTGFDGAEGQPDSTLINGNDHAVRGNSSGVVEVSAADGAVGNTVQFSFDADHGSADGGWISAIDNVLVRALAAGDAQADGDVDPADLIQLLAGGAFGQGNIDATWGQGDFDNDGDFDGTDILAVVQGLAGEFPKTYAHDPSNGVPDVLINPATGNITLDTNGTTIGSIVMDSAAGIFNGPNSPSWDAPGDFAADIDTQISMPISFTNPGYTGVDDLGDGIIGDLAPGFDILADLTIKYLDPNGDLLDAEAHVVPEPSSILLFSFGGLAILATLRYRRRSA